MDDGTDGRWLTYAELAEFRRVDKPSALKLAIRRKWPRRKDNHGTMQVCVPTDWLIPFGAGTSHDTPSSTPSAMPDQAFEAAIASLTAARDQAEARADQDRQRADRAEAAAAGERSRADALRDRLDAAEAAGRTAQEAVDWLRKAEVERRARGLVDRLRAAWRGE